MNKLISLIASDKVLCSMKKLYKKQDIRRRVYLYYTDKLKTVFLMVFSGVFICVIYALTSKGKVIKDNNMVLRNGYGEGNKKVTVLYAKDNGDEKTDIDIDVSEKRYSDNEIIKMSDEFNDRLMGLILSDNKSPDHVTKNLNFVSKIDGYPFSVSYKTDNPLLLTRSGVINEDYIEGDGGNIVMITATISYFDYKEETTFPVCIYAKQKTSEEIFTDALNDAISESDRKYLSEDYLYLPKSVNGEKLTFYEKDDGTVCIIFALFIVAAALVYMLKDKELIKEAEKRTIRLTREYPKLVNKFSLFYGAGMPVKNIWFKLCDDYKKGSELNGEKNELYEEMIITKNEISDGKSEIAAYEDFAARINIPKYRVFINLLQQAVTVGKKDLQILLKRESDDAFNERKNNAKQLFEEAGTKLLIPMFMMLLVVMVIIMFPALCSFKL